MHTASADNLNNTSSSKLPHADSINMLAGSSGHDGAIAAATPMKRSIPMKSAYLFKKGSGKMRKFNRRGVKMKGRLNLKLCFSTPSSVCTSCTVNELYVNDMCYGCSSHAIAPGLKPCTQ